MVSAANLCSLVGQRSPTFRVEIERGAIVRLATALGETRDIHFDDAAARSAGLPGLMATPTFPAVLCNLSAFCTSLGFDANALMHAEEDYQYFKPIFAGDVLEVTHQVVDVYEKTAANGRLTFLVFETIAKGRGGKSVFTGRRVLVDLRP